MTNDTTTPNAGLGGKVVEEEIRMTLVELSRVCQVPEDRILGWVGEGVLEPQGDSPEQWRFAGVSLRRTRVAARLTRDLELNPPGVALALELLDEIDALRSQLQRLANGGRR
jgi:chaperone modulatory protein CbpM